MTIKVSNADSIEALIYDKVHMDSLSLVQEEQIDSSLPPIYKLKIIYRLYAIDSNGTRYFKKENFPICINDYFSLAIAKAGKGDPDLINAMGAIEIALGRIIEDQGGLGTVIVS